MQEGEGGIGRGNGDAGLKGNNWVACDVNIGGDIRRWAVNGKQYYNYNL